MLQQVERIWWNGFWAGLCAGVAVTTLALAVAAVVVMG